MKFSVSSKNINDELVEKIIFLDQDDVNLLIRNFLPEYRLTRLVEMHNDNEGIPANRGQMRHLDNPGTVSSSVIDDEEQDTRRLFGCVFLGHQIGGPVWNLLQLGYQ